MHRCAIEISVIMACYNSSAYIEEAITSVLRQTLGNLELIIIDDCSSDNTLEVAKKYQATDDRVVVLSLMTNSGPATARNAGLGVARGKWVAILDSDDVALPSRFEEQFRVANENESLVIIGSSSISINTKGIAIKAHSYPTSHDDLMKRLSFMGAFPPHSSLMYRRDALARLSAFNSRYVPSEDYDLWLRLAEIGELASVGKPLVKIRKHEQNISNREGGMKQTRMGVAAATCHFLRIKGYPDPSTSCEESVWLEFSKWIETQITANGLYERQRAWADARAGYFATENKLKGAFQFGLRILHSNQASTLLQERLFGISLPQRLATEWMKQSFGVR